MIQPKDPSKGHFYISMIKSLLRLAGCAGVLVLPTNMAVLVLAAAFAWAEVLGIVEEIV